MAGTLDVGPSPTDEVGGPASARLVIVQTRLQPPRPPEEAVLRDRLILQLAAGAGRRLTLVSAPAGFGKSVLLSEWLRVERKRRPGGWLTVDATDDDPVVLLGHIIASLRGALPAFEGRALAPLFGGAPLFEVTLPELANEVAESGPCCLVVDDFHRISADVSRRAVGWLVQHAPANLQLVVSTRADPPFPLGGLRGHGDLVEVRAADLRFTAEEADALLNDKLDMALEAADVDVLVERTEGWAAGLYLAALSLRGAGDRHEFVRTFGGSSSHIVDFLSSEVLTAHEPAVQDFMLQSSVLERLSGPLCDFVLGTTGSAALLEELVRSNMFLVPLDDRREWYRFHTLFAQLLRVELERRWAGLAAILHARSAEWHLARGSADGAIEHYLAGGHFRAAADVIAAGWRQYVETLRPGLVLAWLRRLPDHVVASDRRMSLVAAWALSAANRDAEAVGPIVRAALGPGRVEGPLPDGLSSVESSLAMLRATFTRGDVRAALMAASRAVEIETASSPWRAAACLALGLQLYRSDRLAEAERWLSESVTAAPASGHWLSGCRAAALLSLIAGRASRLREQHQLADRADLLCLEWGLSDVAAEAGCARAASLAARGSYAEAVPVFERSLQLARLSGQRLDAAEVLLQFASAAVTRSDRPRAEPLVAEALKLMATCPDPAGLGRRGAALGKALKRMRGEKAQESEALSARERVVLRMLAGGLPEREIGREMYLSFNTIHSHTKAIYRKLGVSSRPEALGRARLLGLV